MLRLAPGEIIKGDFEISRMRRPLGSLEGRIIVTDSRVLYRARAVNIFNRNQVANEIALSDINGMSLSTSKGLSPAGIIVVALSALYALISLVTSPLMILLPLLVIGGALLLMRSTTVAFAIYARSSEASPIFVASGIKNASQNIIVALCRAIFSPVLKLLALLGVVDATFSSTSLNFEETNDLYARIGALISDLQSRGVLADADQ